MMPCWGFGIQARNGRFLSKIRMLHQNHIHLSRRVGPQIHHSLLTSQQQQQQQYAQNHLKFPHATIHKSTAQSGDDTITKNDDSEYQTTSEEETIFALSSGGGGASVGGGATAVAVIRMSGPCAFDALRELLSPSPNGLSGGGKLPKLPKARMASLRTLYDPLTNNDSERRDPLDSALILTFPGPNSFTGEDIVELHCHGSRAVVNGVLSALTHLNSVPIPAATSDEESQQATRRRLSLRPADPGEFTQRAYAHGKLGLVEVEALSDLIVADTSLQRKQALKQFDGRLSRLYMGWREELIKGLAHAEAVIDFGDDEALDPDEEDDGDMDGDGGMSIWGGISPRITSLRQAMERHLADASRGELLRDGLRIAIVGRPNAGKSSLLNLLAGRDAAIVSSTPGTTRDVVEVILDLGGVRCTLLDTAGVREEKEEGVNEIEVEGMKRARIAAKDAHIVVGVVDSTDYERGLEAVDELINGDGDFDDWKKDNILYVVNKVDLKNEMKDNDCVSKSNSFGISCTTSEGVNDFLSVLTTEALSLVSSGNDEASSAALSSLEGSEGAVITRARHRRHVEAAADALGRFEVLSGQGYMALDMAAEELRLAASELGRITGAIDVEDVLDVLFADFCIGK
eukprot:CAMPEP_0113409432 /NCGR_PEP_ID=MMETSP0013_2-20120614/21142_1 /TAXON_ID=2843 ORGANISM="Skeletonema costatum, Strain 1716" /NCGR_SAMPLE_ID=MMETSP0013_2 /ASSEMBLY_ACC=CAM_ASM_000158 /LENGTH=628 /DNA_ID=CAMNT_0000295545 /DNA_START=226 /DNA_END=2112 /DNA_ORIENTATION=+ /assembly_acc=CAM_ASM_000158